jgi:hypothetical protein
VSLRTPASDCYELTFKAGYPIAEPAEVALEDYARSVTRAREAEGVRSADDPAMVTGIHVCGPRQAPTPVLVNDVEDFARSLTSGPQRGGLGWS